MNEIKPIETIYNGYRFRSRLEARWAVFFDAAGIKYEYEPEGFVGYLGVKYLPDFFLPEFDIYAEVKGSDEQLEEDWEKIDGVIDYGQSPISHKGLIILGEIPYSEDSFPYFSFLWHHKGVFCGLCLFDVWGGKALLYRTDTDFKKYSDDMNAGFWMYENGSNISDICDDYAHISNISVTTKARYLSANCSIACSDPSYINKCYAKARQARFEHGECG